ncbi:MAG: hypothetical protein AAGB15_15570 [Pseudomonadota bacterium]
MEIDRQTETRLVLKDPNRRVFGRAILGLAGLFAVVITPLAIGQNGVIAGIVALAGAGLIGLWGYLILRQAQAIFDAQARRLTIKRSQTEAALWQIPFDQIQELYLTLSRDESGPDGFQLFVATERGDVQLSFAVYPRHTADSAREAAAEFLSAHGQEVACPKTAKRWPGQTRPKD